MSSACRTGRLVWIRVPHDAQVKLNHWPDEVMLDLVAHGAEGHGPVHLLLISAAETGFAWDGEERGWIRALSPFRMLSGAYPT